MALFEDVVRKRVARKYEHIRRLDVEFVARQQSTLLSVVRHNAETGFGRRHAFHGIDSVEAWQRAVPPSTAADYEEALRRTAEGESGLLLADPIQAWALTSGTTGGSKMFPVTKALLRSLLRAIDYATTCHLARTESWSLLRGYALQLPATAVVRTAPDGLPAGFITGMIAAARGHPFRERSIPPSEVGQAAPWADRFRLIEERYAAHDVRMMFGVPGYCLALLRHLSRSAGGDTASELWPGLELIVTSGGPLDDHRRSFERLCPDATLLEMYLCTEAPVAFQAEAGSLGMMPLVEDCFLEFVPEGDWGTACPRRRTLETVEAGVPYVLLVTTPAGLYAYAPGDVVIFTSVAPPRLRVQGRIEGELNLTSERVNGAQIGQALDDLGIGYEAFTGCPRTGDEVAHEWVIEFVGEPPDDVANRLDRRLMEINQNYATVRAQGGLLGPPVVTPVGEGTFLRALEHRPGQGKIQPTSNDRGVRDELVAIHDGSGPRAV